MLEDIMSASNMNFENIEEAKTELTRLRNIIRYHRDQKADDRCWLDDELLYESLPENIPVTLSSKDVFVDKCSRFHANRQAPKSTNTVDQGKSQVPNDDDIKNMNLEEIKTRNRQITSSYPYSPQYR